MHRRPLGRGRTLAAVAGILLVVGCVLPWWKVGGGETGITPVPGNGFEGSGIIVFLVGIATLALVALPYAAGDRPLGDRPLAVVPLLTVVGWIGFGIRIVALVLDGAFQFTEPAQVFTNGPGLWVAGARPGDPVAGDLRHGPRTGLPLTRWRPTSGSRGVWNIVPTPFAPDGALDVASLPGLTAFVAGRGVDGMTILGVLGEASQAHRRRAATGHRRRHRRRPATCRSASA